MSVTETKQRCRCGQWAWPDGPLCTNCWEVEKRLKAFLKCRHNRALVERLLTETRDTYVVVLHVPTGRTYSLDRAYDLNLNDMPARPHECVEMTEKHASGMTRPDWARGLPCEEFTSFWLY